MFDIRLFLRLRYKIQSMFAIDYYKENGILYLSEEELSDKIRDSLAKTLPLCIGKIGGNELNSVFSKYLISCFVK